MPEYFPIRNNSVGMSTGGNTTGTTGFATDRLVLVGTNNITLSGSTNAGSMTISISGASGGGGGIGGGVSTAGNTAGSTGTVTTGNIVFVGSNALTLSQSTGAAGSNATISFIVPATSSLSATGWASISTNGSTISIGASTTMNLYASSNTFGTSSGTADMRSISIAGSGAVGVAASNSGWVISAPAQTNQAGNVYASSNTFGTSSGTYDARTLSIAGSGAVSVAASNAGWVVSAPVQTNQTVGLYATNSTTQNSSTTLDARSLTFNATGYGVSIGYSNGSIVVSSPPFMSSYENFDEFGASSALTWNAKSISDCVAFNMPGPLSASFLRLPVSMTTQSTTIATMASGSATASGGISHTYNAVVYSVGTGANSRSLQYVASGSAGYTFSQQISVTKSTQYSISLGVTFEVEGQVGRTNLTTQYSISNTNYSFTTDQIATNFSGNRWLDIPFASSLSPGPYWLIVGYSSNSGSGGAAGLAALTNCYVAYSNHYVQSQPDLAIGVLGSTNKTSGGYFGAGSFSTAGGGTTNSLPISAISSRASNPRIYFQAIRSA